MSRIQDFDFSVNLMRAILWQYEKAKNLQGIVAAKAAWYEKNQTEFWENWRKDVFDLNTANDFGLSVWSIILNIPLYYGIPGTGSRAVWGFGQYNQNFTADHPPLNIGYNFGRDGDAVAKLTTEQKRLVLKLRYFQITSDGSVVDINRALKLVFGEMGPASVIDPLDMSEIIYALEFVPTSATLAVLENFDVLPRPAAIGRQVRVDPRGRFGFEPYYLNFNNSNFGGAKPRPDEPTAPLQGNFVSGEFLRGGALVPAANAYSFQRASEATYFDQFGLLATAGVNSLRLEYDPMTGEPIGALIEDTATNLTFPSTGLGNAQWNKTRIVGLSAGQLIGLEFTKLVPNTQAQISHQASNNRVFDAEDFDRTASISLLAKMDGADARRLSVRCWDTVGFLSYTYVILDSGGKSNPSAGVTLDVKPIGDGIYKLLITQPVRAGATTAGIQIYAANPNSNATTNYDFNGEDGYLVSACQFEFGSEPSSYIPTGPDGTGTRAADILTLNAPGKNDWVLTFDDGSTQEFPGVIGPFVVPSSTLSRRHIVSFSSEPA